MCRCILLASVLARWTRVVVRRDGGIDQSYGDSSGSIGNVVACEDSDRFKPLRADLEHLGLYVAIVRAESFALIHVPIGISVLMNTSERTLACEAALRRQNCCDISTLVHACTANSWLATPSAECLLQVTPAENDSFRRLRSVEEQQTDEEIPDV